MTATRDATPTVRERAGERKESDDLVEDSPFDPPRERFEARGELGRGGMGRVTDAYDHALKRPVAIKEMLSASGVDLARFEREARITARLEHPGIVPIHDAGRTADGTPFYVMRRIDGQPLDQLIETKLEARLALIPNVLAACDAVAFAHARGVVHRDIKPTNILVGPFGETLVIDWGIARELENFDAAASLRIPPSDTKLTRAGTVAGTPGFMSPEQARGEAVDARADVFALGATLFFVLAGHQPYGSASATEMVDLAGAGREPDWKRLPSDVPPELRAITKKAMAMETDERYADAGALASDLRRFITGNLVAAYDYGFVAKLGLLVKRHRGAVAVAAVSLALLFGVAIFALHNIVAERDQATAASTRAEAAAARLLVQHARTLADSDPVAAVIALRSVVSNPDVTRAAWVAAAAAYVHGIPFGFESTTGGFIQISHDSKRALIAGWKDSSLTVVDLIARTSRVITHECVQAGSTAWLGPDHAVCNGTPLRVVDLNTGVTRSLGLAGTQIAGDRDSRVWIVTRDGHLYELDDPNGQPRELASGVTQMATTADLDLGVFQFGSRWELRVHGKILPIPMKLAWGTAFVSSSRVALYDYKALHVWDVIDDTLVHEQIIPEAALLSAAMTEDMVYMYTTRGVVPVDRTGIVGLTDPTLGAFLPTTHGCIQLTNDGALRIRDALGWIHIERHANGLRHADVSPDERFAVATTGGGETLVWDLHELLPIRVRVPSSAMLTAIEHDTLWFFSASEGVARFDLRTQKLEAIVESPAILFAMIERDGRWAGGFRGDGRVFVTDMTARRKLEFDDVMVAVNDGEGVTFVRSGGAVWRWLPGDLDAHASGTLGADASMMTARGTKVGALVGAELVRLDDHSMAREHIIAPPNIDQMQIAPSGKLWVLADHRVWVWNVGTSWLERVPSTESINDIVGNDDALVMSTSRSITTVRGGTMHTTPVQPGAMLDVDRRVALLHNDRDEVIMLDLRSGTSFTFPGHTTSDSAVMSGNRVAAMTGLDTNGQIVSVWTIAVPDQPLALEAWLGTITNARQVGSDEVYAWP